MNFVAPYGLYTYEPLGFTIRNIGNISPLQLSVLMQCKLRETQSGPVRLTTPSP